MPDRRRAIRKARRGPASLVLALLATAACATTGADPDARAEAAIAAPQSPYDSLLAAALTAYDAGDREAARGYWLEAAAASPHESDPHVSLSVLALQDDDARGAADHAIRALDIVQSQRPGAGEADAEWSARAANVHHVLVAAGAALFRADRFEESAEVAATLLGAFPQSRDARYNLAISLYSLERWSELAGVAQELVIADPLNHNVRLLLFNAYRGFAEESEGGDVDVIVASAIATLQEADRQPFDVAVELDQDSGRLIVTVTGRTAPAGQTGTLLFEFFGPLGSLGQVNVPVTTPAPGAAATFEATLPTGDIVGWTYRLH